MKRSNSFGITIGSASLGLAFEAIDRLLIRDRQRPLEPGVLWQALNRSSAARPYEAAPIRVLQTIKGCVDTVNLPTGRECTLDDGLLTFSDTFDAISISLRRSPETSFVLVVTWPDTCEKAPLLACAFVALAENLLEAYDRLVDVIQDQRAMVDVPN